jgi:hypothetical protein
LATTPNAFYVKMRVGERPQLDMASDEVLGIHKLITLYEDKNNLTADITKFCGDNKCYLNIEARQVGIEKITINRCAFGNSDLAYVTVEVEAKQNSATNFETDLTVYNGFSPNGDNVNEH